MHKVRVGIIGHSGYSGAEVVKILRRHPRAAAVLFDHRADGGGGVAWSPQALREQQAVLLFLATPPEVSMELAPLALQEHVKVVDLSGAFRLRTPENYQRWYGAAHARPDLLAEAAYGLPEFCRDRIRSARLVANPGCYPTAASLALQPLVAAGVIDRSAGIVCDAKSGVSGAGKKATSRTHFCAVTENLSAYAVLEHRHVPEVLLNAGLQDSELSFTAQLLPVHRGILETIYFRANRPLAAGELVEIYRRRYGHEPFLRIYQDGKLPDLQAVAHTNFCDIGVKADPSSRRVVVVAAIDNLVKGAAGQAIQNMNLLLGFTETEGLL
jgi:N-acetyl-gamma-glutamyl-phosphate reductase